MEKNANEKKFLSDKVANILLNDKEQLEYVKSIISKSTGIGKEKLKTLELISNRINENVNTKYSYADAMYEDVTDIFNIECNITDSNESRNKNTRYCSQLILKQVKPGKKDKVKLVWQININDYDKVGNGEFINTSRMFTEKDHLEREYPLRIIDINVDKLRDIEYTKLKEGAEDSLEKLLYVFICPDEEKRNKLYNANEIMEKVCNQIDSLTEEFTLYYDHDEYVKNVSYEVGEKRGKEEGIEQGKKEQAIETAKDMLKDNEPIEKIIKYSHLTKEEMEKLQKEIN